MGKSKRKLASRFRRAARVAARRTVRPLRQIDDVIQLHDIDRERRRQALIDTARFINENLSHLDGGHGEPHETKLRLLRQALSAAPEKGLVVEFGVASGATLREIAAMRLPAHGFDSFEGLPQHWRAGYEAGMFAQPLPPVGGAELHVGWFQDTLPDFLATHVEPFAFVHMDADLYSSTRTVFEVAEDRFVAGTVIVFDEYFNFPGWQQHEHKAFTEFIEKTGHEFEYLGYNGIDEQLAVRLTS